MAAVAKGIDEYIAGFPEDVQTRLQQVRAAIKKAAPEAEEAIKYAIPTFVLRGNVVSFAGYKNHIGVYPIPAGNKGFKDEIIAYRSGASTAQFPHDKPLPLQLITQLTQFRIEEMLKEAAAKKKEIISATSGR